MNDFTSSAHLGGSADVTVPTGGSVGTVTTLAGDRPPSPVCTGTLSAFPRTDSGVVAGGSAEPRQVSQPPATRNDVPIETTVRTARSFVDVGQALLAIRNNRLYRTQPGIIPLTQLTDHLRTVDVGDVRDRRFIAALPDWPWMYIQVSPASVADCWHVAALDGHSVFYGLKPIHRDGVVMQVRAFGVMDAGFVGCPGRETKDNPFGSRNRSANAQPSPRENPTQHPATDVSSAGDDGDHRCVYFLQAADRTGLIKIGVAGSPAKRVADIQRMSPVRLEILGLIRGAGQAGEARLHRYFAASRIHGEWFEPTTELLAYITDHADAPAKTVPNG